MESMKPEVTGVSEDLTWTKLAEPQTNETNGAAINFKVLE